MSGDYEMLEINQPNITYLNPESYTERLEKLIIEIDELKNNISKAA